MSSSGLILQRTAAFSPFNLTTPSLTYSIERRASSVSASVPTVCRPIVRSLRLKGPEYTFSQILSHQTPLPLMSDGRQVSAFRLARTREAGLEKTFSGMGKQGDHKHLNCILRVKQGYRHVSPCFSLRRRAVVQRDSVLY